MQTSPSRAQRVWDLVLALCCAAVAVPIQVTGVDAVPANRAPDAVSVLLTLAALLPLAWRRSAPLVVFAACFPGFLGLIGAQYSVGAAPIGVLISFYTVAAWDNRRNARVALVVAGVGYSVGLALGPIDLSVEGALVQVALLVGGRVVGTGVRQRREFHMAHVAHAERQLERERERAQFQRERAAYAATEERLRISRELHDILGHAFSVMVVQAGVAELLIDSSPADARRAVTEIRRTGRESLAEMRRLLHVLRDGDWAGARPRDPAATLADIPSLIAAVEATGLPVDLLVTGTPDELSPGLELAAYRVIQEALTNTMKHAHASKARVSLTHAAGTLTIEVNDDGRAKTPAGTESGHGHAGMRERVAMYGGELTAKPTPDGYLVVATLPTQPLEAGTTIR